MVSVGVLLAGVGRLVWAWAFLHQHDEPLPVPAARDPLTTFALTPPQRSRGKYLFMEEALFVFQVLIGGFTAHYTVEGQKLYGLYVYHCFQYTLLQIGRAQFVERGGEEGANRLD